MGLFRRNTTKTVEEPNELEGDYSLFNEVFGPRHEPVGLTLAANEPEEKQPLFWVRVTYTNGDEDMFEAFEKDQVPTPAEIEAMKAVVRAEYPAVFRFRDAIFINMEHVRSIEFSP